MNEDEKEEDGEDEENEEEEKDDDSKKDTGGDDKADDDEIEEEEETNPRKVHTCRLCNKPMRNTGHMHFRGIKYCPSAPGQIPLEEWLTHHHIESKIFDSESGQ